MTTKEHNYKDVALNRHHFTSRERNYKDIIRLQ